MSKKQKMTEPLFGAYVGLDLSLAGTGACMLDDAGQVVTVLAFSTSKREVVAASKGMRNQMLMSPEVKQGDTKAMWARTVQVADAVLDWMRMWAEPGALVAIEDHAFGARGTSIYQLGHLHGLVRHGLQRTGYRWLLVAPTELKAAVTGKGNADKNAMMKVATPGLEQKAFGASTRNNVVDAYWLAQTALAWSDAQCDDWDNMSETMAKVMRPHSKRAGLMARELLP